MAATMSFKDHVLCLVAEYERMEQSLKSALRENGTLRDRLKSVGGSQEPDTSPSTDSGRGSGQAGDPPEERPSQKLTGNWDAPAEPVASLAVELPLPDDLPFSPGGPSPRLPFEERQDSQISGRSLLSGQERHVSQFSGRSLASGLGGQEGDRFCFGTNSVTRDGATSRNFGRHGRESSARSVDFGGAPPEVWPEWADESVADLSPNPSDPRLRYPAIPRGQSMICGEAISDETSCLQHFVVRPNSEFRATWDLLSMGVLCYDIISIPLEVFSFDNDETFIMGGMEWFTTVFWTMDIGASFLTGFHHEGLVEMRPSKIASRYMRNGLAVDLVVVLVDWILAIFTFNIKAVVRVGKTARVFRLLRMVRAMRLIRSFKIARLLTSLFTYIKSDLLRTLCSIFLMLLVLCVLNHYIACGWYLMGVLTTDGWLQAHIHGREIDDMQYVYMTSLHWSLTQFTPASMEVYPHNFSERVYCVTVLLFALVTFSSFVSGITSGMMYLRKLKTEPAQQEAILRQYFQESRISAELGQRIWKFLQNNHFQHRKRVHRKDLEILELVPEYLNNKLSEELYNPVVTWNPFFRHFGNVAPAVLNEVCHHAVNEKCLTTREELFLENKVAERMSFITMGTMEYRHREVNLSALVTSGLWACEPVLWLNWVHCGTLSARTSCELIQLQAGKFRSIVTRDRFACDYASNYAKLFRDYLIDHSAVWYTDIWCNATELDDLLNAWEDDHPHLGEDISVRATTWSSEQGPTVHMQKTSSSQPFRHLFQRVGSRLFRTGKRSSGIHNNHHGNHGAVAARH